MSGLTGAPKAPEAAPRSNVYQSMFDFGFAVEDVPEIPDGMKSRTDERRDGTVALKF